MLPLTWEPSMRRQPQVSEGASEDRRSTISAQGRRASCSHSPLVSPTCQRQTLRPLRVDDSLSLENNPRAVPGDLMA